MYLFMYTPIKKETYPHSVWFTFPCGLFSLKSSISTKSTTRKRAKPPLKTTKNTSIFYRGIFSTFLVLFSGRALGHYARAREELRVLTNTITSTYQQKWRNATIQMRNSFLYTRNSLSLQHKHSQTHEKRSNQLSRKCSY